MDKDYKIIEAGNKSKQGLVARLKSTSEQGIVVGEINENNQGWQIQFSFDNKSIVKRLDINEIELTGKIDNDNLLLRLARDIFSTDSKTKLWTSEILCSFIEEYGADLKLENLGQTIDKMIELLSKDNDYDIDQKLAEGIFEFIWLNKLDKKEEKRLLIRLAKLNKDVLFCYLDDEDYRKVREVDDFIKQGRKY
ncbi:hypothetical protein [Zunongwangia sp.]|uniref:hypothetical protein n=1 Tax=Zunongwangia sp. TaxID=1965325 RepID=UPI003AA8EDC1